MNRYITRCLIAVSIAVASIAVCPAVGQAQPQPQVDSTWNTLNRAFDDVMGAFRAGLGKDFPGRAKEQAESTLKTLPQGADFYGIRGTSRYLFGSDLPGEPIELHRAVEFPRPRSDLEAAQADLLKAIELAPERSDLRLQLARCYVMGGNSEQAKQAADKGYELRLAENTRRKPPAPDEALIALALFAERWPDVHKLCDPISEYGKHRDFREYASYAILSLFAEGRTAEAEAKIKAATQGGSLRDDFSYVVRIFKARNPSITTDELLALAREQAAASGATHIRDRYACLLYDQLTARDPKLAVAYHERAQVRTGLRAFTDEQIATDRETAARLGWKPSDVEQPQQAAQPAGAAPKGEPVTITDANFDQEALKHPQPVVLFFWAEWAGPARQMNPTIRQLARDQAGKLRVGMVNIDDQPTVGRKYDIRSIPALVVLKDGALKGQHTGGLSKEKLDEFLRQKLGKDFTPGAK